MQVFRFKLEKLLEYREHLEFQEKQKFAQVLEKYTAIKDKMAQLERQYTEMLDSKKRITELGSLDYLLFQDQAMRVVQSEIYHLQSELEKHKEPLLQAQQRLNSVIADRKSIEILEKKAFLAHIKAHEAEEQKQIDEYAAYMSWSQTNQRRFHGAIQ